jgi:(heptosyl)LPS beta-1,4-glucosyltransferase
MPKVSVVICCANSEGTLEAACRSAAWADELIVVDSGSTDATARIAQEHAHRYLLEPWRGYTEQKKFGAAQAMNDWVFVLDGDEEISPELAGLSDAELERLDVFLLRRRNWVMGRTVRSWWPDWQSRLIHRRRCHWASEMLHDARRASSPSRLGRLRGNIEHKRHSQGGFRDYFDGRLEDSRLILVAREMYARGNRCGFWSLLLRPAFAFLKFYVLKHGWLDGTFGLLIAQKAARGAQLKYAALWAVQEEHAGQAPAESRALGQPARDSSSSASSRST